MQALELAREHQTATICVFNFIESDSVAAADIQGGSVFRMRRQATKRAFWLGPHSLFSRIWVLVIAS